MAATQWIMICCDACGHPTAGGFADARTTRREARRVAKGRGWRYIGPSASPRYKGRDLCPQCQPATAAGAP